MLEQLWQDEIGKLFRVIFISENGIQFEFTLECKCVIVLPEKILCIIIAPCPMEVMFGLKKPNVFVQKIFVEITSECVCARSATAMLY